jgi:NADPH:quinone reductase-like Zn-dependent oxidoreductase
MSGSDFAGKVVEVGSAVSEFAVGDHVFGTSGYRFGAHAEYICVKESARIAHKPSGMNFEEAAAVCDGALAALTSLRHVNPREGQRIVVYGASGAMGTAAVQLAKHFGSHVTAVCNTKNVELARSLGADEVVDYLEEDFRNKGETYDVVLDAVGKYSFRRSRRALKPRGIYVATDLGFMWHVPLLALWSRRFGDKKLLFPLGSSTKEDVLFLKELIEAGKYRAIIDRTYPLEGIVEAARYVETGQKTGNVVLKLNGAGPGAGRREDVKA